MNNLNLTAIVAMDQARGIGKDNQLLWHMPADLKHFKTLTLTKTILMGRKTYTTIGKALPNRTNVVLTRNRGFKAANVTVIHNLKAALDMTSQLQEPLMIIGGAEIYQLFLPYLNRIELTLIKHTFNADTFFPNLPDEEWHVINCIEHKPDEKNRYPYQFITLKRIHNLC